MLYWLLVIPAKRFITAAGCSSGNAVSCHSRQVVARL
jgi:hypothetical protein